MNLDPKTGTLHVRQSTGDDQVVDAVARWSSRTRAGQHPASAAGGRRLGGAGGKRDRAWSLFSLAVARCRARHRLPPVGRIRHQRFRPVPRWPAICPLDRRSPVGRARRAGLSSAGLGHAGRKLVDAFCDSGEVVPARARVRCDRAEARPLVLPDSLGPGLARGE